MLLILVMGFIRIYSGPVEYVGEFLGNSKLFRVQIMCGLTPVNIPAEVYPEDRVCLPRCAVRSSDERCP